MNKHISAIWKDLIKDPSIKNGEKFEDDVADYFLPEDLYDLIHRSHDVNTNSKRFIESSLWPDFQFRVKGTSIEFWVECKWRGNNFDKTKIDVFKKDQLSRYKNHYNTFLLLCTYFHNEECYYFVPMWHIQYDSLFLSFLRPYEVIYEPPIMPG